MQYKTWQVIKNWHNITRYKKEKTDSAHCCTIKHSFKHWRKQAPDWIYSAGYMSQRNRTLIPIESEFWKKKKKTYKESKMLNLI